ncbi:MAG TPA: DNA polymerase III subunit gamma/tau [Thermoanaerobaculia bacterium]|jgi:DNA polymerase-3 subunit gamma/tau|nr:DNA polymerase III subunit gamma/tau [Thermoanaerobaculia bacterium]
MSYQALARKYRPQSFSDVIGQDTVVRTLQNAIEGNRIHHAYLFAGVRGVGKTTAARILAKALNCVKGPTTEPCNECTICREITEGIDLDVREIDAATYTGVDNIRELRDITQFQPARDRNRIFIIDEAHMLSTGAWNALLKLLEEPPPHVVLMFATTEINKVPQTIISRVQKEMLRKITLDELKERVRRICESEGIEADRGAIEIIARRGEGSVRDALSLLDQVIAFGGRSITAADVATVLGLSDTTFFARIASLIAEGDHGGILEALDEASESGRDFKMLYRDLLSFFRNLLLVTGRANESMLAVAPEDLPAIRTAAEMFSYSELLRIANLLLRDDETVNRAEHQRLAVEIALLKAATFPRLRAVEEALAGGSAVSQPRSGLAVSESRGRAVSEPRPEPASTHRETAQPRDRETATIESFIERVQKARPLIGGYLGAAKSRRRDGSRLLLTFNDSFTADQVTGARGTLEQLAAEVFGETMSIDVQLDSPSAADQAAKASSPLRDDPVVQAFQKHLGADLVESRKR